MRRWPIAFALALAPLMQGKESPIIETISSGSPLEMTSEIFDDLPGDRSYSNLVTIMPKPGVADQGELRVTTSLRDGQRTDQTLTTQTGIIYGLSDVLNYDEIQTFSICDSGRAVVYSSTDGTNFVSSILNLERHCGETKAVLTASGPVVGVSNFISHKQDFYRPDLSGTWRYTASFPQTGSLFGGIDNSYRIGLAANSKSDDLWLSGYNGQDFSLYRIDGKSYAQISRTPIQITLAPRLTEQELYTFGNGVAGLTIDGQHRYRLWTFFLDRPNNQINPMIIGDAPPGILDGTALVPTGPNTLTLSFRRADGDVDVVKYILDPQQRLFNADEIRLDSSLPSNLIDPMTGAGVNSTWSSGDMRHRVRAFGLYLKGSSIQLARFPGCTNQETSLCNSDDRFLINASWRTPDGKSGQASAVPLTNDTGYFWFFNRENVEIMVKVLNGCAVNNRVWVFAGGLTDVEVEMSIYDTLTGAEKTYRNEIGQPFQIIRDTDAFSGCTPGNSLAKLSEFVPPQPIPNAGSCVSSDTALCVSANRFRIEASWETPNGNRGTAKAVRLTDDSGYFWFFDAANVELVTKMLNACSLTQSHWIFTAGLTDVKVDMTVTDTTTGQVKRYENPQARPFELVRDIAAFTTCP